jgi:hypothetical protein
MAVAVGALVQARHRHTAGRELHVGPAQGAQATWGWDAGGGGAAWGGSGLWRLTRLCCPRAAPAVGLVSCCALP